MDIDLFIYSKEFSDKENSSQNTKKKQMVLFLVELLKLHSISAPL